MTKKEFYEIHLKGKFFNIKDNDELELVEQISDTLGFPFWSIRFANNTESIWKAGIGAYTEDLEETSLWVVNGLFNSCFRKTCESPKRDIIYLVAEGVSLPVVDMLKSELSQSYSVCVLQDGSSIDNVKYGDKLAILLGTVYIYNRVISNQVYSAISKFLTKHNRSDIRVFLYDGKQITQKKYIRRYRLEGDNYGTLKLK